MWILCVSGEVGQYEQEMERQLSSAAHQTLPHRRGQAGVNTLHVI